MSRISTSRSAVSPTFFDLLRFENSKQFSLGLHAQVGDFVEKQGTLVGGLEQPLLRGDRSAERALHVAEQLAFQQRGRQRAAISTPSAVGPCGG